MTMRVLFFLAAQCTTVSALSVNTAPSGLRGSDAHMLNAEAKASEPGFVDERGERGHFYYSQACEDCFYKGAVCGCAPAMEYFACLTKHCHTANDTRFDDRCSHLGSQCSSELDIECNGPDTVCTGKHNQVSTGGLGLDLETDGMGDDAFCGPHGNCVGTIHMKVNVHTAPLSSAAYRSVDSSSRAPGPAPAAAYASSPFPAPAPATAALMLECGLPKPNVSDADIDDESQWDLCRTAVSDDKAACDLPMFPTLQAAEGKKAYCLLTEEGAEGDSSKRLTEPAWFLLSNIHEKQKPAAKSNAHRQGAVSMIWTLAGLLALAIR